MIELIKWVFLGESTSEGGIRGVLGTLKKNWGLIFLFVFFFPFIPTHTQPIIKYLWNNSNNSIP
jgi:hypothetical protein